jgi:biopolymer transport protein ExbD
MRVRRLRKEQAHLEITAFINLIVVLVPFLLSVAVFSRLSVIDLTLPAQSSGVEKVKDGNLLLEVIIRPETLEVNDRIGGALVAPIPNTPKGPDVKALATVIYQLKVKFPDKLDATILAQPDTPYDTLVQVMDAVRITNTAREGKVVKAELFPNISIGDAPIKQR